MRFSNCENITQQEDVYVYIILTTITGAQLPLHIIMYFYCYNYVFLLLCLFLLLCMLYSVYSVSLCCSMYCFMCKCAMYYCHRLSTQSQLTNTGSPPASADYRGPIKNL